MKSNLHILTRPEDSLAAEIIRRQQADAGLEIRVIDLTKAEVSYEALIQEIFQAESLALW